MENKYYVFISYSRKDIQDAKWIHSSLEKFHIPAKLPRPADAEPIPKPLRCFRDINDLDVMPESFVKGIENALESSKYLVVVCSPNSAKSNADGNHYVDWEIKKYIEIHGIDYAKNHILPVIIDGEISNNTKENECLPPSLYNLGNDFLQHNFPILNYGEDKILSKESKNDFILKILSFLLQVQYSVLNDRYLKEQKRKRNIFLGAAISLSVIFALISVYAGFGWKNASKNLAFVYYTQANSLMETNDVSKALAYYNKSLQLDKNPVVQKEVYNLVTNASWLVEKDSLTPLPEKESEYFIEKELREKLNATTYYEYSQTGNIKNGILDGFSDDKNYAVLIQDDFSFNLVDINSNTIVYSDKPKSGYIWSNVSVKNIIDFAFRADNSIFIYVQEKERKNDYDYNNGFIFTILDLSSMNSFEIESTNILSCWEVSPDGQFLVYSSRVSNNICELVVYDLKKGQVNWKKRESIGRVRSTIIFSPDCIHFAASGSVIIGDKKANEGQIYNCFDKDDVIDFTLNSSIANMQFSNDGRKLAASSDEDELYVFKTRDGVQLVKPRLFTNKILSLEFTPDDNNLQVMFNGNDKSIKKEYEIRVNALNYETSLSNLDRGVIFDTILLKNNAICNFIYDKEGDFLEYKTLDNKISYITPMDGSIVATPGFIFLKSSPSKNTIFIGSRESIDKNAKGMVGIYTVNYKNSGLLTYLQTFNFPYAVKNITPLSDTSAIVLCKENKANNLYLLDFSNGTTFKNEFPVNECYDYALNNQNGLFTISTDSDGICFLKKWNLIKQTEDWSVNLGQKSILSAIIKIDSSNAIYVVLNNNQIFSFDKNGKKQKEINYESRITFMETCGNGNIVIGTNPLYVGKEIYDLTIQNLRNGNVLFRTDYLNENPVSIKEIKLSNNGEVIHIAGNYLNDNNGFYDIWDIKADKKFSTDFSNDIEPIFNFELLDENTSLLYTSNGTIIKKIFTSSYDLLKELEDGSFYKTIGAWTINQSDIPVEYSFENEVNGPVKEWLFSSGSDRTINPESSLTLNESFEEKKDNSDFRELMLDIQSNNEYALDWYWFDIAEKIVEKNFKNKRIINSQEDESEISSLFRTEWYNNAWEALSSDEEASKTFLFHLHNYIAKCPDSAEPYLYLCNYYSVINDSEKVKELVSYVKEKYPDNLKVLRIILNEIDNGQEKLEKFKYILQNKTNNYDFDKLHTLFKYFYEDYAPDLNLETIKSIVNVFITKFKEIIDQDPSKYAYPIDLIYEELYTMIAMQEGGFEYLLNTIDYLEQNLSKTDMQLIGFEKHKTAFSIMNNISKRNISALKEIFDGIDLNLNIQDIREEDYLSLLENAFMYYSMTNNPKKDELLERLLEIDETIIHREMLSSAILQDIRIYKKLGITDIVNQESLQKIFNSASKLMINRLNQEGSIGIKISEVFKGGQAESIGLKAGDIIILYDDYFLNKEYKSFFIYDLHISERKANKENVEITILRDGELLMFKAKEGLLGIGM